MYYVIALKTVQITKSRTIVTKNKIYEVVKVENGATSSKIKAWIMCDDGMRGWDPINGSDPVFLLVDDNFKSVNFSDIQEYDTPP